MRVFGIESSCDETGVAIYDSEKGIIAEALRSSSELHIATGGIVPETASRDHSRQLLPLIQYTLNKANLSLKAIDAIAYTKGPGLIGSLMVGTAMAKSLAFTLRIPTIGVHHLEGHIRAVELDEYSPSFPFIALLVSGGHSHIYMVNNEFNYSLLGATRDDAAGEAFDKCANMLGLDYPGGAQLARLAQQGNGKRFSLPRPMATKNTLDMSFSGLKTAVRYLINDLSDDEKQNRQTRADIAAAVETAIIDSLLTKLNKAVIQTGIKRVVVAGGVSANKNLRERLNSYNWQVFLPPPSLCTDNGAMIAYAGAKRLMAGYQDQGNTISPLATWPLFEI